MITQRKYGKTLISHTTAAQASNSTNSVTKNYKIGWNITVNFAIELFSVQTHFTVGKISIPLDVIYTKKCKFKVLFKTVAIYLLVIADLF